MRSIGIKSFIISTAFFSVWQQQTLAWPHKWADIRPETLVNFLLKQEKIDWNTSARIVVRHINKLEIPNNGQEKLQLAVKRDQEVMTLRALLQDRELQLAVLSYIGDQKFAERKRTHVIIRHYSLMPSLAIRARVRLFCADIFGEVWVRRNQLFGDMRK